MNVTLQLQLVLATLGLRVGGLEGLPIPAAQAPIFLVTSTLLPSDGPLSYSPVRSAFGAEERMEQTCVGLESVRERVPGALVILAESSSVEGRVYRDLMRRVDWVMHFDADPLAVALRDSPFKGAAETFMVLSAMMRLRHTDYPILFKLSGRYGLSKRFELSRFPTSGFGLHSAGGVPSTRLYSVAKDSERTFIRQLRRALWLTSRGHGVEQVLFDGVPAQTLHMMDVVGVKGLIGVGGDDIDE